MHATGRPVTVRGEQHMRVVRKVRSFHARGMSYLQMEQQTGVSFSTISDFARGRAYAWVATWDKLDRMGFEEPAPHVWVSPEGSRRRLRALWASGYPLPWLAERLGYCSRVYLQMLLRGTRAKSGIEYGNAKKIAKLYDEVSHLRPEDVGVRPGSAAFARTWAAKKGWGGTGCWDPETIDDPDALPEWTGACGTEAGYQVHYREKIPYCQPCRDAHREYALAHPGPSTAKPQRWAEIQRLRVEEKLTIEKIAVSMEVSERTVIRALKELAA